MQSKLFLFRCTIIAALGGLLFGFDTAVISGAEGTIKSLFQLSLFQHGFTVASALIGTIIGAIIAGKPADRFGRKPTLIIIAILYIVSSIGSTIPQWHAFVFFRFLGGLAVGGASVVSPLYIAEISPAAWRGRLVAVTQFNIVLGILLAYLSNYTIAGMQLGANEWRWMFGVEAIPAAVFFLLMFVVPETPRWLIARGRLLEAAELFGLIGYDAATPEQEVQKVVESLVASQNQEVEPFFCRKYLKPILLAFAIATFNQLSGVNALLYYSKTIFTMAGMTGDVALMSSVVVGFTNLIFTMAAMAIIDFFGRKKLMLVGSVGYILSLGTVAWAFFHFGLDANGVPQFTPTGSKLVLGCILLFIASHAFGQGAVIWVFIGEIFPNSVRARGQALGSFTHWFWCAVISWTFPLIAEKSGGYAFAIYAVCMGFQLLWVVLIMPETKGIPLEEMQKKLLPQDR